MQILTEFIKNLTDPQWIVQNGGLYIVVLIVFIETGLIFGFFLPGDPLLFVAGMIIANTLAPFGLDLLNLLYWIVLIASAGIMGNYVSYWLGRKSDGLLFQGRDHWLFKQKYLVQARDFYEKKGGGAIVLARFVPVIRTFAPVVAGVVKMHAGTFSLYNILGSFLWAGSIVSAGYLLGENAWVQAQLEWILIGIVVVATAPVVVKMITRKKPSN